MLKIWLFLLALFVWTSPAFATPAYDLSCANVLSMRIMEVENCWYVNVQLNPKACREFYELTKKHVHGQLTVTAGDHRLLTAPVQLPIDSGSIQIKAGTREEALRIADLICAEAFEGDGVDFEQ